MSDQLFYLFSAVLLGLVIGALIMYFSSGLNKDSEKTIAEMEKKLSNYQNEVAEHFEQTANLVDDMTQSYKKVFDHLGKSARLLMTDEQIQEQIEKRKGNKVVLEFLTDDPEEIGVEEELDEIVRNKFDDDKSDEDNHQPSVIEKLGEYRIDAEIGDLTSLDETNLTDEDISTEPEAVEELVKQEKDELEELELEVEQREKEIYT